MRSKPRGLALIINIFSARNQDDRVGSHVDVKKIQKLFSQIGYKITTHSDLTAKVSLLITTFLICIAISLEMFPFFSRETRI